jgi:phospholipase/carboxylesterase
VTTRVALKRSRRGPPVLALVVLTAWVACSTARDSEGPSAGHVGPEPVEAGSHPARILARPDPSAGQAVDAGLRQTSFGRGRTSYLYVPRSYDPARAAPLVVMLHGAGGNSRKAIGLFLRRAEDIGAILFAPQAQGPTWDLTLGGYGADAAFIDRALRRIFSRLSVDPRAVAIEGFSDGASYALSLGVTNGDLFRHVIALSPGFMAPGPPHGSPRVFVAHGRRDGVLPLESTSDAIVPRLREAGYDVTYLTHPDGHSPLPRLREALRWLVAGMSG